MNRLPSFETLASTLRSGSGAAAAAEDGSFAPQDEDALKIKKIPHPEERPEGASRRVPRKIRKL